MRHWNNGMLFPCLKIRNVFRLIRIKRITNLLLSVSERVITSRKVVRFGNTSRHIISDGTAFRQVRVIYCVQCLRLFDLSRIALNFGGAGLLMEITVL